MRSAIERDFNHPSIFAWCLFNETWGFGGQVEFVKLFSQRSSRQRKPAVSAAGVSALATEVPEKNCQRRGGSRHDPRESFESKLACFRATDVGVGQETRFHAADRRHECRALGAP